MKTSKFKIVNVCDYVKWNKFIEDSPQGSIFFNSHYLNFTGKKYALYLITKGEEIKAGISLLLSDDSLKCEYDYYAIYNGIVFGNTIKKRSEQFEITEFIINELTQKYNDLEMQLSPHFEDLRPFLWHNYHNSGNKFTLDLKYTSYVNIESGAYSFGNLSALRRRNIKEALKDRVTVTCGLEIELFLDFHQQLLETPIDKLKSMGNLIYKLIENDQAQMFLVKNVQGKIIYIVVFCFDSKRAYYLYGAGDPNSNERYKGTIGFWEAFKILNDKYNIKQVDFEGVNSPNRGWFKLSFGGNLLPYYHVKLEENGK